MAKFRGVIGYVKSKETAPGVWTDKVTKRTKTIEIVRNMSNWQTGESANDNLKLNNQFSTLADPYAQQNFSDIKYVEFKGTKWKVTSVEPKRPRLILQLGGVWNGDQN